MKNNYNSIARHYDFISRLVFRRNIIAAQVSLIKNIQPNSSVLIVGGGTGWILEEISKLYPEGLKISYVEISSAMISLAQKINCGENKVIFINEAVENFITTEKFDVIFTAFFFDNFIEKKIEIIFKKLNSFLKNEGLWLYADFVYDKKKSPLWQKFLLRTMYIFFRVTANIETQELINMDIFFAKQFDKLSENFFYAGFIKAFVYKKNEAVL